MVKAWLFPSDRWIGLRLGRRYFVVKSIRRNRPLFTERNRINCRHVTCGDWRFLVRTDRR